MIWSWYEFPRIPSKFDGFFFLNTKMRTSTTTMTTTADDTNATIIIGNFFLVVTHEPEKHRISPSTLQKMTDLLGLWLHVVKDFKWKCMGWVSSYDNFSPSFSLLRRACGIEPFRLFLLKFLLNHRNNIHIGEHDDYKECYNRICQEKLTWTTKTSY